MAGGVFPGAPVILHGHNRDLGWAFVGEPPRPRGRLRPGHQPREPQPVPVRRGLARSREKDRSPHGPSLRQVPLDLRARGPLVRPRARRAASPRHVRPPLREPRGHPWDRELVPDEQGAEPRGVGGRAAPRGHPELRRGLRGPRGPHRVPVQRAPPPPRGRLRLAAVPSGRHERDALDGVPALRRAAARRGSAVRVRGEREQHALRGDDRDRQPRPRPLLEDLRHRDAPDEPRPACPRAPWKGRGDHTRGLRALQVRHGVLVPLDHGHPFAVAARRSPSGRSSRTAGIRAPQSLGPEYRPREPRGRPRGHDGEPAPRQPAEADRPRRARAPPGAVGSRAPARSSAASTCPGAR